MSAPQRPFLGAGLGFPPALDAAGALVAASGADSIAQAIWIILGTARGERRMRPDFGCGIADLVFESATAATAGRVAREVRDALAKFEPRIDVVDVAVAPDGANAALTIDISYRIRATNAQANLVYPFYLAGGTGA